VADVASVSEGVAGAGVTGILTGTLLFSGVDTQPVHITRIPARTRRITAYRDIVWHRGIIIILYNICFIVKKISC
jgi:hypothetical protein